MPVWPAPETPDLAAALANLRDALADAGFPGGDDTEEWRALLTTARARFELFLHVAPPRGAQRDAASSGPGPAIRAAVVAWNAGRAVPALRGLREARAAFPDDVEAAHTLAAAEVAWRAAGFYRPWDGGVHEADGAYDADALASSVRAAADQLDAWGAAPLARVLRAQVAWRTDDDADAVLRALADDDVLDAFDLEVLSLADDVLPARGWPDLDAHRVSLDAAPAGWVERLGHRLLDLRAPRLDPDGLADRVRQLRAAMGSHDPPPLPLDAVASWVATTAPRSPARVFGRRVLTALVFGTWEEAAEALTAPVRAELDAHAALADLAARVAARHDEHVARERAAAEAARARQAERAAERLAQERARQEVAALRRPPDKLDVALNVATTVMWAIVIGCALMAIWLVLAR